MERQLVRAIETADDTTLGEWSEYLYICKYVYVYVSVYTHNCSNVKYSCVENCFCNAHEPTLGTICARGQYIQTDKNSLNHKLIVSINQTNLYTTCAGSNY